MPPLFLLPISPTLYMIQKKCFFLGKRNIVLSSEFVKVGIYPFTIQQTIVWADSRVATAETLNRLFPPILKAHYWFKSLGN